MRFTRRRDEAGSLPVAMLIALVGVLLSTQLVHTVIQQSTTTKTELARVTALNAAQTGLAVAMAHLRAANDGSGSGVLASLPCGSLTGTLATVAGATRSSYTVAIAYYPTDPQSHPASWLLANLIPCLAGGGTLNTPGYALLTATGTYSPGSGTTSTTRVLKGTYLFQTTDLQIPGGLLHINRTAPGASLCIDAGSSAPAAGSAVQMQPCSAGTAAQTWAYNANLTLSLPVSKTGSMPLGLCLDAGSPHALGNVVYLQPCATTTQPQQQWNYNGSANFEGTGNDGTADGYCFNVQTPNTAGSFLVLGSKSSSTCKQSYDDVETFTPETSVGAGAASIADGQLVNFRQFGRCVDVTGSKVDAAFLIVWPCKQSPNPATTSWNQKWTIPTRVAGAAGLTGLIFTDHSSVLYCLRSPLSTASNQYVTVTACTTTSTAADLSWTVHADTGTYATSYTLVDSAGNCLSPTDPTAPVPDLYSVGIDVSKLIVAGCDGSTLQKWDAPPSIVRAIPLKDLYEN